MKLSHPENNTKNNTRQMHTAQNFNKNTNEKEENRTVDQGVPELTAASA